MVVLNKNWIISVFPFSEFRAFTADDALVGNIEQVVVE